MKVNLNLDFTVIKLIHYLLVWIEKMMQDLIWFDDLTNCLYDFFQVWICPICPHVFKRHGHFKTHACTAHDISQVLYNYSGTYIFICSNMWYKLVQVCLKCLNLFQLEETCLNLQKLVYSNQDLSYTFLFLNF